MDIKAIQRNTKNIFKRSKNKKVSVSMDLDQPSSAVRSSVSPRDFSTVKTPSSKTPRAFASVGAIKTPRGVIKTPFTRLQQDVDVLDSTNSVNNIVPTYDDSEDNASGPLRDRESTPVVGNSFPLLGRPSGASASARQVTGQSNRDHRALSVSPSGQKAIEFAVVPKGARRISNLLMIPRRGCKDAENLTNNHFDLFNKKIGNRSVDTIKEESDDDQNHDEDQDQDDQINQIDILADKFVKVKSLGQDFTSFTKQSMPRNISIHGNCLGDRAISRHRKFTEATHNPFSDASAPQQSSASNNEIDLILSKEMSCVTVETVDSEAEFHNSSRDAARAQSKQSARGIFSKMDSCLMNFEQEKQRNAFARVDTTNLIRYVDCDSD